MVYIIAEAGASHGGNFRVAHELVRVARFAGANAVKFQIWRTDKFVSKSSIQRRAFEKLEFSPEEWTEIFNFCGREGIDFLASAWDEESVDFLNRLGVAAFKIGSGDLNFHPLLRHIGSKGKPVYLSTGMGTREEIVEACRSIRGWNDIPQITLLKCTVDYPCREADVNLAGMREISKWGEPFGLSDHTKGFLAGPMAVAMGASVIEKHFGLEDSEESIGGKEFARWVEKVRTAEGIMGNPNLGTFPCEEQWKKIARRGPSGLRE